MDKAPMRRGKDTTHIRYGTNTAILTGDVMLIYVYKLLRQYPDNKSIALIDTLTEMSISLCEGQQMDMDFEQMDDVQISDYINMIENKTAVLFAACLKMGSITGGADAQEGYHLYEFGKNIGIAFQIQDDILDIYGDQQDVGKNKCGDIVQNKKTFLYLKALELCSDSERSQLIELYKTSPDKNEKKIRQVMDIFNGTNVQEYARQVKEAYLDLGLSHIEALNIKDENKSKLRQLSEYLVVRSS
jgi:geranylgeranyl diphosphate synthase, type II